MFGVGAAVGGDEEREDAEECGAETFVEGAGARV